jgi:hypothetical protein
MPDATPSPSFAARLSSLPRPSFPALAVLLLAVVAGAGLNIYRVSSWKANGVHSPRGFSGPTEEQYGRRISWARSIAKVEVFNQAWRPRRMTITLRGPDDAPAAGVPLKISADYREIGTVVLHASWSQHTFVLSEPAASDGRLWLEFERTTLPTGARGFAFANVETTPIFAARPLILHGSVGAVLGAVTWFLLWPGLMLSASAVASRAERGRSPAPGWRVLAGVAAAVFVYLSFWALIRPPFQTPDEPQHFLRTVSILRSPWFADPGRFELDERFVSPFAFLPPDAPLQKLPFYGERRLSAADIAAVKATPWTLHPARLDPFERIYASYPTLFYLSLFGAGQSITEVWHLTPYQSAFAYRFVTIAFAALLWAAAYAALKRTPATHALAEWILLIVLLNPMLAFMSSGINTDAVSFPLSMLAILSIWQLLTEGTGRRRALLWLLTAAMVKPSAGALFIALISGVVVLWLFDWWRSRGAVLAPEVQALEPRQVSRGPQTAQVVQVTPAAAHPWLAVYTIAQAGIIVAWAFYLWSPLLFANQEGVQNTLGDFFLMRWRQLGWVGIELWGRLGWLDYQLSGGWYVLLYALVALNLACVAWRPRRSMGFVIFVATVFLAFGATTLAGEFTYLPQAGYTLQGRYFLPAILGFIAPALWHRVTAARYALLAGLIVVSLLLVQKTVSRYYDDGWVGVGQALPFS